MKNAPAKVTEAHKEYQKLLEVLKLGRIAGAMLGQQLYRLFANRAYQQAIGEEISWHEFLKMPEVNIDPREATRSMEIYEEFCVKRGFSLEMLAEAGTKTLHRMLPMVKKGELEDKEIDGLLHDGAALSQSAFKERFYEVTTPEGEKTYTFQLMRKCAETNNMTRVPGIEHDQIITVFKNAGIDLLQQYIPEVI